MASSCYRTSSCNGWARSLYSHLDQIEKATGNVWYRCYGYVATIKQHVYYNLEVVYVIRSCGFITIKTMLSKGACWQFVLRAGDMYKPKGTASNQSCASCTLGYHLQPWWIGKCFWQRSIVATTVSNYRLLFTFALWALCVLLNGELLSPIGSAPASSSSCQYLPWSHVSFYQWW